MSDEAEFAILVPAEGADGIGFIVAMDFHVQRYDHDVEPFGGQSAVPCNFVSALMQPHGLDSLRRVTVFLDVLLALVHDFQYIVDYIAIGKLYAKKLTWVNFL